MIIKYEIKKVICTPMIWSILVIFFAFNTFQIWIDLQDRDLTGNTMNSLHSVVTSGVNSDKNNKKNELEDFYINAYEESICTYDNLNTTELLNQKMKLTGYSPSGSFEKFIEKNYEKLQVRVEQIKSDGEAQQDFYPGKYLNIHSLLYCKVFRPLIVEMAIIIVLSILFLMDYDRIHKTNDLTITSKIGRKLMRVKASSGMICGLLFSLLLMISTLSLFFLLVPFNGLWKTSISAAVLAEVRTILYYPFISFWKLSVLQYLILSIVIAMGLLIIIGLSISGIQMIVRNSYLSFLGISLICIGLLSVSFRQTATWLDLLISFNPVRIWYVCGGWFMEHSVMNCFSEYEFFGIGLGIFFSIICYVVGWTMWKKSDIK